MTMTHRIMNIDDCNILLATKANMTFDETEGSPTMVSRFDSASHDEQQANSMPSMTPISPCFSEESLASSADVTMSVTGKFSNIEDAYHVDPRVLGTGHHGSVRECVDRVSGQRCAVKSICKSDPAVVPDGLAREVILLREMKHGSIVQLVDFFEDADYVHIVTDLCTGGELFDKITKQSSNVDNSTPCFAENEAARIMHQILHAVSYMHKKGIAHRDIKPENILFDTEDEDSLIKIIDFGLSRKHFEEFGDSPMTEIVGTPYYIAPDVLKGTGYDKSCDLWSVGVIAYILLAGYPPFNGSDNSEVYNAIRQGRYQFPSSDWAGTSRQSRDFIRRLLQKDPRKRMTAEQALNHPWMVTNADCDIILIEDDCQDNSFVEVVLHRSLGIARTHCLLT